MKRINCNYCGGRMRKNEIFLRHDKKYWCDSCYYIQKSEKMRCPGCNKKTLSFGYETKRTTIMCINSRCPQNHLTFISYYHDHLEFPQIIGTIQNFRSSIIGLRNSEFNR